MRKVTLALSVLLTVGSAGLVWAAEEVTAPEMAVEATQAAAEMANDAAATMENAAAEMKAEEVNNTICPLTGRVLKIGEEEIAKLEFNGKVYNVCPVAKAAYDKDPASFAEKLAEFSAQQAVQVNEMKDMAGDMKDMAADMKEMTGDMKEMAH